MLTRLQAEELTRRINASPAGRFDRVIDAWQGHIWLALDYRSWEEYCAGEFGRDRLTLPSNLRHLVIGRMKAAGMSFEDVEAVVMRGGRVPVRATPAHHPTRIEDELGFTPGELDLIGALLEVDDDEFGRVLAAGRRRGDLSKSWVGAACWDAVRRRRSLERDLERATRAVSRARELLSRSTETPSPQVREMLTDLEDHTWDLLDEVDALHARHDRAAGLVAADEPKQLGYPS